MMFVGVPTNYPKLLWYYVSITAENFVDNKWCVVRQNVLFVKGAIKEVLNSILDKYVSSFTLLLPILVVSTCFCVYYASSDYHPLSSASAVSLYILWYVPVSIQYIFFNGSIMADCHGDVICVLTMFLSVTDVRLLILFLIHLHPVTYTKSTIRVIPTHTSRYE